MQITHCLDMLHYPAKYCQQNSKVHNRPSTEGHADASLIAI